MSGSMGNGPVPELLSLLNRKLEKETQISVVCGNNIRLWKQLNRSYGHCGHIHILSYESDVSLLFDSADLLLSKPGGLCTTEASVKGLPMVLFQAAGGCERSNLEFFRNAGGAKTGDTPDELCVLCSQLLSDPKELENMSRTLKALFPWNAAERICETFRDCSN